MASSVAGVIEPTLQAAETARSAGRPTDDLTAYDLDLRAYALVLSSSRQNPEALRPMEQAIARDPRTGRHWRGPRSAVFGCFLTAGAKTQRCFV